MSFRTSNLLEIPSSTEIVACYLFFQETSHQEVQVEVLPPTPGGGFASPQTLKTAIGLVPAGLPPIAVFPPYIKPRTVPAVSVIFAENPDIR